MVQPSKRRSALIAVLLIGATLGAVAGASSAIAINDVAVVAPTAATLERTPLAPVKLGSGSLADMVEAVGPAVVQIEARPEQGRSGSYAMGANPFGEDPNGWPGDRGRDDRSSTAAARGSGFVIDPSGLIVTNDHVVANARTVSVKFSDGRELTGRVLGRDPKTDLAVVRIEGGGRFTSIPWGDSDVIRVGDGVFAVGSPFGLGNTVTSGIVSARGREIGAGPYDDFLQVDAAINSGNSGGPLFNANGQVIGVNTAIFSPSGGNVGIGFAIPSRMAQSIVRQIATKGHVVRGRIGVGLQPLTPEIARELGLASAKGALITDVEPGGPAALAGLQRGDVVTAFAGRPIEDSRALSRAVAEASNGAVLPATVIRGGRSAKTKLRIAPMRDS